ncbi:MAG: hypothetical protein JO034_17820, partial [Singulisphaera sp.]|nr:hypothetical protein [Singulisphaera sp.]
MVDLIAYRLPWLLWLLATIFWYLWFGCESFFRMLGRMSAHWFPLVLILVVDLMAVGQIDLGLGIPMLFRDDPTIGIKWYSPALWGAFGATVLIGEVWIVIYIFEYIGNYIGLDPNPRQKGWDRPKLWATPSQSLDKFRDCRSALEFLAASTPPFLVLLILVAAFPAGIVGGPKFSLRQEFLDVLEYVLGILLGGLAVAAMIFVGWWLTPRAGRVRLWWPTCRAGRVRLKRRGLRRGVVKSSELLI